MFHSLFAQIVDDGKTSVFISIFAWCPTKTILSTGYKSRDSVPRLVDDYLAGKVNVDEFITHNMPLEKINEAFDLMHAGKR